MTSQKQRDIILADQLYEHNKVMQDNSVKMTWATLIIAVASAGQLFITLSTVEATNWGDFALKFILVILIIGIYEIVRGRIFKFNK